MSEGLAILCCFWFTSVVFSLVGGVACWYVVGLCGLFGGLALVAAGGDELRCCALVSWWLFGCRWDVFILLYFCDVL